MIKCPVCGELISPSAPVYRVSRGFLDADGIMFEDADVIFHQECADLIEPYVILEEDVLNS
mgnify:FL=1|tara:strand:+ start:878 stop:1060 length:183 start_codon:yes stop_codon:yes gene_type:complete